MKKNHGILSNKQEQVLIKIENYLRAKPCNQIVVPTIGGRTVSGIKELYYVIDGDEVDILEATKKYYNAWEQSRIFIMDMIRNGVVLTGVWGKIALGMLDGTLKKPRKSTKKAHSIKEHSTNFKICLCVAILEDEGISPYVNDTNDNKESIAGIGRIATIVNKTYETVKPIWISREEYFKGRNLTIAKRLVLNPDYYIELRKRYKK